jgi:hypothetical protein
MVATCVEYDEKKSQGSLTAADQNMQQASKRDVMHAWQAGSSHPNMLA